MELNPGITTLFGDKLNPVHRIDSEGRNLTWESKGNPPKTSGVLKKLQGLPNLRVSTIINALRDTPSIDNAAVVGTDVEYLSVGNGMVIIPVSEGIVAMVAVLRDANYLSRVRVAQLTGPDRFTIEAFEKFIDSLNSDEPKGINFGIFGNVPIDDMEERKVLPRGLEYYRESITDRVPTLSKTRSINVEDQLGRNLGRKNAGFCVVASTSQFDNGIGFVIPKKSEV
jgi:hypothetical protein